MRTTLLIGLLLVCGCNPPKTVSPPVTVPTTPTQESTPAPITGPNVKKSERYMSGYWDGYHGGWLAPFRYSIGDEYRSGWQQGRSDKKAGIERFNTDGSVKATQ